MARKSFGAGPLCYPQNVFIIATYNEDGSVDVMNAAWGGISDTKEIILCLSADHKTTENILKRKAYTISLGDAAHVIPCDYVGLVSGNKEPNKFEKAGFTATKSELVDAPIINELPICLEVKFKAYDMSSGHVIGDIVNVSVDESVLTEDGKVDVKKADPIVFDSFNHKYMTLGEVVADAFGCGKELK